MAARRSTRTPNHGDDEPKVKRPRAARNVPFGPDGKREVCALAKRAASIYDTAARVRGLTNTDLGNALSSSHQTQSKKRSGEAELTLWDIESLSEVLRIPPALFLGTVAELLTFLASEASNQDENGGPDQGLRPSGCNYVSPDHDPETVLHTSSVASGLVSD